MVGMMTQRSCCSSSQLSSSRFSLATKSPAVRCARFHRRRQVVRAQADPGASQILEAFYYGRAFAVTLNKRLGEAVTDVIAEVSKFLAENPSRLQEFQEEVEALARSEMPSGIEVIETTTISTSESSVPEPVILDLDVVVDDLRAEIASARAVLQAIKTDQPEA